jgi:hypothetical protein
MFGKRNFMRKILLVFDGINFSEGAFEFARRLNDKNQILVAGVFVPQVDFANLWSYAGAAGGAITIPLIEDDESREIEKNIERFNNYVKKTKLNTGFIKIFMPLHCPN